MSDVIHGGPAFPEIGNVGYNSDWQSESGMTIRQYAAVKAMQGLLASGLTYGGSSTNREALAKDAVAHADALMSVLFAPSS
jgi:hypothetical protein